MSSNDDVYVGEGESVKDDLDRILVLFNVYHRCKRIVIIMFVTS